MIMTLEGGIVTSFGSDDRAVPFGFWTLIK